MALTNTSRDNISNNKVETSEMVVANIITVCINEPNVSTSIYM